MPADLVEAVAEVHDAVGEATGFEQAEAHADAGPDPGFAAAEHDRDHQEPHLIDQARG